MSRLRPEEKVEYAISMTDTCTRICADAVRDQNPHLKEKELMEEVRKRIDFAKSRHHGV